MDLSFNLAPSYRDLKDPNSRQNFEDTPGQIPKLILTLRRSRVSKAKNISVATHGDPRVLQQYLFKGKSKKIKEQVGTTRNM